LLDAFFNKSDLTNDFNNSLFVSTSLLLTIDVAAFRAVASLSAILVNCCDSTESLVLLACSLIFCSLIVIFFVYS